MTFKKLTNERIVACSFSISLSTANSLTPKLLNSTGSHTFTCIVTYNQAQTLRHKMLFCGFLCDQDAYDFCPVKNITIKDMILLFYRILNSFVSQQNYFRMLFLLDYIKHCCSNSLLNQFYHLAISFIKEFNTFLSCFHVNQPESHAFNFLTIIF